MIVSWMIDSWRAWEIEGCQAQGSRMSGKACHPWTSGWRRKYIDDGKCPELGLCLILSRHLQGRFDSTTCGQSIKRESRGPKTHNSNVYGSRVRGDSELLPFSFLSFTVDYLTGNHRSSVEYWRYMLSTGTTKWGGLPRPSPYLAIARSDGRYDEWSTFEEPLQFCFEYCGCATVNHRNFLLLYLGSLGAIVCLQGSFRRCAIWHFILRE